MRIIGGKFKGRKLSPLKGSLIRPTADRIRESIFNILGSRTQFADVLDLYAGTGAMGLEAISRGALRTIFIDNRTKALETVRKNIQFLNVEKQTVAIKWDISNNLDCIKRMAQRCSYFNSDQCDKEDRVFFSLVFIDPPYNKALIRPALNHLKASGSLRNEATVVVEHASSELIPEDFEAFAFLDQRKYGQTMVSFLSYMG